MISSRSCTISRFCFAMLATAAVGCEEGGDWQGDPAGSPTLRLTAAGSPAPTLGSSSAARPHADASAASDAAERLVSALGNYRVRVQGRAGGPVQSSAGPVGGSLAGVLGFGYDAVLSVRGGEPGLINVPKGATLPGVNVQEVGYGKAQVTNTLDFQLSTQAQGPHGTFMLWSQAAAGVIASEERFERSCTASSAFSCPADFSPPKSFTLDGEVNLIYCVNHVTGTAAGIRLQGVVVDTHTSESTALNMFGARAQSVILGSYDEPYLFAPGSTTYEIEIVGDKVRGVIRGQGQSITGLISQPALFDATFEGTKI